MSTKSTVELYESDADGEWSIHIYKETSRDGQLWVSVETRAGVYIDIPLEDEEPRL